MQCIFLSERSAAIHGHCASRPTHPYSFSPSLPRHSPVYVTRRSPRPPPPFFCRVQSGLLNDGKHSCVACLLLSAAKQGKSRERKKAACACAPFYARCKPVGYRGSARKGPPPSVRGVYFAVSPVPPSSSASFYVQVSFLCQEW